MGWRMVERMGEDVDEDKDWTGGPIVNKLLMELGSRSK